MKKIISVLIVLITPVMIFACDICGCGVGNNYIGILPEFQKHVFGIRYRTNSMLTHIGVGGATTYLTTQENYRITELWGGWNINEKFRVMASLPYSFNEKTNQGITETKNGIGDVSVFGFYQLLNKRSSHGNSLLVQSLWLGAGVKLATGKYNPADHLATNASLNLFQLGTGSYDFNIQTMYDIRLQDAGINVTGGYKMNTANKYDYQYGNRLNVNGQFYYKFRTRQQIMIAPNTGIQYEQSAVDRDGTVRVASSGGNLLLGTVGMETAFKRFSIGGNYQTPLSQHLAKGMAKAQDRWMIHVAVVL